MSKTLLIIGAGREQIPAYELAKNKGLTVVGTDMAEDAPALEFADHKIIASTRDAEETVNAVLEFSKNHKIDGVMTIANDVPYTVAKVAEGLGIPGVPPEAAKRFMNKIDMKTCFKNHGVRTPDFKPIISPEGLIEEVNKLDFPLILKPSDGRGSRGVLYLDETIDLNWAFKHSLEPSDNKILILEKFISGPQLSVEGLFLNNKYQAVAFADRNYDNLDKTKPFIVEDGGQIPTNFNDEILLKINELIENAAKAMDISWGSVKADIVLGPDGPEIIELAGRLSGNYLATHHIPMAYGVDIVGALIEISLGTPPTKNDLIPKYKHYLGVRYFFPKAGVIKEINGVSLIQNKDYVWMLDIFQKPGDIQPEIDNHGARAGTIICEAKDYYLAKTRVEDAVKDIEFLIE